MPYASPRSPRVPYPDVVSNRRGFPDSSTPGMSYLADGIEYKNLEFDIDVLDAIFNRPGRYFVKMTVQSLFTRDYSQILLRKWPDKKFTRDYEALTSVTTQRGTEHDPEICVFDDRKFTFRLPEGFCKNDKNHDVYLLLEAFNLPTNNVDAGKKVGEGKVAIYPRTNAPRTKHNVNPGEDMYKHTTVVTLLRTPNKTGKAEMHCGRMRCCFTLKEHDLDEEERRKKEEEDRRREAERRRREEEDEERRRREEELRRLKEEEELRQAKMKAAKTPEPAPPPPITVRSPTSEWGDTSAIPPASPSPPPPSHDIRKTNDSPLPDKDLTSYTANKTWRHTARPGFEQVDVIVHGASNLPLVSGNKMPQPFTTAKTLRERDAGHKARSRTHAVARPTNAPSWEELISLEIDDKLAERESLVLGVHDNNTRGELIQFSTPVSLLKPFHQYHVEMVLPPRGNQEGIKLYASVIRKLSALPKDPSSPNYLGLEVFLRGVKYPLGNPVGPLIAVARIVPDYYNYKSDRLLSHPRAAEVSMNAVTYPNPRQQAFSVPGRSSHGYPQLSLLGRPEEQPVWNHPYLFCDEKDKATMFTPSAALVIEYYVANAAMTDEFWRIKSPVGFSSLPLDQKVYKQLKTEKAHMGMRVDGIPIMGSELRCEDGRPPTIGMVLKLITTDKPDSMVVMSNLENLPEMELKEGTAPHTPEVLYIKTPTPEPELEDENDMRAPGMYLRRLDKYRSVRGCMSSCSTLVYP